MNELINMLPMTSSKEAAYASIYAAEKKEENVMAAMTGVVRILTDLYGNTSQKERTSTR
jgi:hypothetical protein